MTTVCHKTPGVFGAFTQPIPNIVIVDTTRRQLNYVGWDEQMTANLSWDEYIEGRFIFRLLKLHMAAVSTSDRQRAYHAHRRC